MNNLGTYHEDTHITYEMWPRDQILDANTQSLPNVGAVQGAKGPRLRG